MSDQKLELLKDLKKQIEKLPHRDSGEYDRLFHLTNLLIDKVLPESDDKYHKILSLIRFYPSMTINGGSNAQYDNAWCFGHKKFNNLIDTMIQDYLLSIKLKNDDGINSIETSIKFSMEEIFIVHGHNQEMLQSVARTIEALKLKPIILNEQVNKSRTLIQKFIDHSNVGFAIIIMSADDVGMSKSKNAKKMRPRARQNVILELGFFLGRHGQDRIFILYEPVPSFEKPSDIDGVLYTPYDKNDGWKLKLAQELSTAGYKVNANNLL